ncbi:O-antigen ligase family protein [Bosea sp. AAP35]|uniref:O-antigen ligase family protein n=1 Tax=Bosea sp. AAP35 TaxID=1523417 RepID=UPI0009E82E40|nr:O-antigen ligase family protein [Bosea sp. AAP35]
MSNPTFSRQPLRAGSAPALWSARWAMVGHALLVALPLSMWIANRSAPLMLALAAVAFAAACLLSEGWRAPAHRILALCRDPIGLALCGFLLWSLVTLAGSHRPVAGLAAWGELALPLACGAVIAVSRLFRPGISLGRALALSIIAAVSFMLVELATDLALRIMLDIGRQQSFIFNRPILTCLMLSSAALATLRAGAGTRRRDGLLAALVVLAAGIASFGSESGAAGLGFILMALVWMAARVLPRLTLWAVMAGFAATMAFAPAMGRLGDAALPPSLHERLANSHSRDRVDIWLSFGEAAMARPLLGAGFGTSPTLDRHPVALAVSEPHRKLLAVGHPHNAPLQAWAETGAIGAALLTFAGLALLYRLRRLGARDLAPRLALFASAFGIASVAHGAWQGWWIAALTVATLWLAATLPQTAGSPTALTRDI